VEIVTRRGNCSPVCAVDLVGYGPTVTPKRPSHGARVEINAEIDKVFSLLADPWIYADWVVGSDQVREADDNWPDVGSEFKHVVGVWPLKSHDHSWVEAVDAPNHLRLRVKARPFVTARVWLDLKPGGKGTVVEMFEDAADPLTRIAINPLSQPLMVVRNKIALGRLRDMAEGRRHVPTRAEAQAG
jgi:uncharacterized protein YndB with AHSA1/START domain